MDVTFNLKDFKVILAYCASTRNNLSILFSKAGEPLAILPVPVMEHMHISPHFCSEFILATMVDSLVDSCGQPMSGLRAPTPAQARKPPQQPRKSTPTAGRNSNHSSSMNTHQVASHLVALNNVDEVRHSSFALFPSVTASLLTLTSH